MANILTTTRQTLVIWKDFQFPLSIKDFSLKEDAKVATYEYAGRNGAEHERVLKHRVFTLTGEFIAGIGDKEPKQLVRDLRLTNNNKPGRFWHSDIGKFVCIMGNLTITQNGTNYSTMYSGSKQLTTGFSFSMTLLEHTPPNAKTLSETNDALFPKTQVKPASDIYSTKLIYKNCDELFNAIIDGKILAGVNPIINAEWLRYDYDLRKCAFDRWKAAGFKVGSSDVSVSDVNTNQKYYVVKPGDTGMRIAKMFKVTFTSLFEINRNIEVRTINKGTECKFWKTSRLLFPGDKILIPDGFTAPVKRKPINRVNEPNIVEQIEVETKIQKATQTIEKPDLFKAPYFYRNNF